MSVAASSTRTTCISRSSSPSRRCCCSLLMGWWLRKLGRTAAARIPIAALAVLLMAVNIVASDAVLGARNWLEFGGFSFQPSELVKVGYIYVGASTLDRLYRRNNSIPSSASRPSASSPRSHRGLRHGAHLLCDLPCSLLSALRFYRDRAPRRDRCGACGLSRRQRQSPILPSASPHGGMRGRIYDKGFQQTRAMSAAASGGLYGKGRGRRLAQGHFRREYRHGLCRYLRGAGAYNRAHNGARGTGAGFLRRAQRAARALGVLFHRRLRRDEHVARAACAQCFRIARPAAVYGSYLPVRLRGGTSLISCWMLMAFIKSSDTRRNASFAVRPGRGKDDEEEGNTPRLTTALPGGRSCKLGGVAAVRKITNRAFCVLLIAAGVIFGMIVYVLNYIDHGQDWALYFSQLELRFHRYAARPQRHSPRLLRRGGVLFPRR